MLNKLNYFNKLLCFSLLLIVICVSSNNYINILIVSFPFAYFFHKNKYWLMLLSGISFIIYSVTLTNDIFLWLYRTWEIYIYSCLLKTIFSKRERIIFINRTLYGIKKIGFLTRKIFYKDKLSKYSFNDINIKYRQYLKKEYKKKVNDDLVFTTVLARTRFYGYNRKRKEYGITDWNTVDSTVFCVVFFIAVISFIY